MSTSDLIEYSVDQFSSSVVNGGDDVTSDVSESIVVDKMAEKTVENTFEEFAVAAPDTVSLSGFSVTLVVASINTSTLPCHVLWQKGRRHFARDGARRRLF